MNPGDVDRVFGRSRLRIATGPHVEVFRDAAPGGRRRYSKRFLATATADFRPWTERERRILEKLGAHGNAPVARLVAFSAASDGDDLQTYDAGPTVDEWASRIALRRGGTPLRNVFEDCAHWWALARQCLVALDALQALRFVHLDLKADNICLPWSPAETDRPEPGERLEPRFEDLAFIDVAFSLVQGVEHMTPLPLAYEPLYEYQSPRLLLALAAGRRGDLRPTRALDWRCDIFSLAAMLWRYLPELEPTFGHGWSLPSHRQASAFVRRLLDAHAADPPGHRPHRELIALATERLREPELAAALQGGCTFDPQREVPGGVDATPPTRIFHPRPAAPAVTAPTTATAPASDRRHALPAAPGKPAPSIVVGEPAAANTVDADPAAASRARRGRAIPTRAAAAAATVALFAGVAWWLGGAPLPRDLAAASPRAQASEVVAAAPPRSVATPAALPAQVEPRSRSVAAKPAVATADLAPDRIPGVTPGARRRLEAVLAAATDARELPSEVRAAALANRSSAEPVSWNVSVNRQQARTLNEAALAAYGRGNAFPEAIRLQTRAFEANPLDSEVVGNLAYLRLRERPPQAETARELALHALTLNDSRFPSGRVEDWTTFAIASALTGHEADARRAWYVTLALAGDLRRHCNAAVRAQDLYGDQLRPSVQAMLQRAETSPAYRRCTAQAGRRN